MSAPLIERLRFTADEGIFAAVEAGKYAEPEDVLDCMLELLAALKKLNDAIDSCVALTPELLAEVRAAIAKAEGGAA